MVSYGNLNVSNYGTLTFANNGIFNPSDISGAVNLSPKSRVIFNGNGTNAASGLIYGNLELGGNVTNIDLGSRSSIAGDLILNPGGFLLVSPVSYTNTSRLIYQRGSGNYNVGLEWTTDNNAGSTTTPGQGFPNTVIVNSNLDISSAGANLGTTGSLTVNSAILTLNNSTKLLRVNGDLTVNGELDLSTQPGGDLVLISDFHQVGIFSSNSGAVFFNSKTKNQNFYGDALTTFNTLNIDNAGFTVNFLSNGPASVQHYSIQNQLNVLSGTLNLNSLNLILKSTNALTASVTNIQGTLLNADNLTAERYYPAHRSWRLITPILNSSQTIKAAWQEGQTNTSSTTYNATPGYGTLISGVQGGNLGFDYTLRNNPSMKTYNSATDNFIGIPSTNTTLLSYSNAYMLFVRGSRASDYTQTNPSDATVLRSNGILIQGNKTYVINTPVSQFTAVGNPYPCAIDMHTITRTSGLQDKFTVWDTNLTSGYGVGAFVTYTFTGPSYTASTSPSPTSTNLGRYIQSGQAFFIQGSGSAESITIKESDKVVVNTAANIFDRLGDPTPELRVTLSIKNADGSYSLEDGTVAVFGDNFSNGADAVDAGKMNNLRENIYLQQDTNMLAIEARKTISNTDTLRLGIDTYVSNYRFSITSNNLDGQGLIAYLLDKKTGTQTTLNLSDTTMYDFSISNTSEAKAKDRFIIIFKKMNSLPVTFVKVNAEKINEGVKVFWKVENQLNIKNYEVIRSEDGINFKSIVTVDAVKANSFTYTSLDKDITTGKIYYRIKSVGINGENSFSNIVPVNIDNNRELISIYPNPIVNGKINIHFNKFMKGAYDIRIMNIAGQVLYERTERKADSTGGTIILSAPIIKGKYQVHVNCPNGSVKNISIVN